MVFFFGRGVGQTVPTPPGFLRSFEVAIGDIKQDIITFYNKAFSGHLTVSEDTTELDIAIQLCLNDLSTSLDALVELDDSQELESGTDFIVYPTDFKELVTIVLINGDSVRGDPLEPLKNGQIEYDRLIENSDSTGTPEFYTEYDGGFYIYPNSSGAFDVEIKHYRYHPTGQLTDILFDSFFTDCIKFGTVYYESLLRTNPKYISIWQPIYLIEKEKCRLLLPDEPAITKGSYS